jgi:hypothetical protein
VPWLHDQKQSNLGNLNKARREASRNFRNKKREYLKAKINELEINSKNKNIRELYRGSNHFKKGYQPRTNIVKDEKGDLVADCHRNKQKHDPTKAPEGKQRHSSTLSLTSVINGSCINVNIVLTLYHKYEMASHNKCVPVQRRHK